MKKKITEVQFNQGFSRNKEVSTESAGCIEKGKINSIVWHQQSFALEEMLGPQECEFARWVRGQDSACAVSEGCSTVWESERTSDMTHPYAN